MTAALSFTDFDALFRRQPKDAIAYLQAKGFNPTWDWHEALGAIHQKAFTVAGLLKMDVLETVRKSLVSALEEGQTYREWQKGIAAELGRAGLMARHALVNPDTGEAKTLAPWRLKLIYRQNLQSAHMAGRWAEMSDATDSHPNWQWVSVMDSRTRPMHAILNGMTFRHDDPIWANFWPPIDYLCRCRVRPLTDAAVAREGISMVSSKGRLTMGTVEVGRGTDARQAPVARFEIAPGRRVTTGPGFVGSPADSTVLADQLAARRAAFAEGVKK